MSVCCVGDTLQNCTLELATLGDLKLVEKPQPVVLAPHDFCNIKANVKVASTENGIIFGNIGNEIIPNLISFQQLQDLIVAQIKSKCVCYEGLTLW